MIYVVLVLLICLLFGIVYSHFLVKFDEIRNLKGYPEINNAFKKLVKQHRLSIYAVDRFDYRLVAIDRVMGILVLIEYKNGITLDRGYQLDELLFCKLVKSVNNATGNVKRISLELTFQNNNVVSFLFFDDRLDKSGVLNKRLRKALYWKREIQFQQSVRQRNAANHGEIESRSQSIKLLP